MKIIPRISGWSIEDCDIIPIEYRGDGLLTLSDIEKLSCRSAQWILDHYNLVELSDTYKKEARCNFGVQLTYDDIYKISIMENHPELEKELDDYFCGNWDKYYLRFFH